MPDRSLPLTLLVCEPKPDATPPSTWRRLPQWATDPANNWAKRGAGSLELRWRFAPWLPYGCSDYPSPRSVLLSNWAQGSAPRRSQRRLHWRLHPGSCSLSSLAGTAPRSASCFFRDFWERFHRPACRMAGAGIQWREGDIGSTFIHYDDLVVIELLDVISIGCP